MIVWTHQLYHTAIVTGLQVAELYTAIQTAAFLPCDCNPLHVMQRTALQGLSVRPSVICTVTKQEKLLPGLIYHMKDHFSDKKNGGGVDPFYLEFWAKLALFGRKRRFSIDIRS